MSIFPFVKEEPMKLFNTKTHFVVMEFKDHLPIFYDRFLEVEMKDLGITIHPILRKEFKGKEKVYPTDSLFKKAFLEIYYPMHLASPDYQWKN